MYGMWNRTAAISQPCLDDTRTAIVREGLPWFHRFESLEYVLSLLMDDEELPEVCGSSSTRKHMIGFVARALGRSDVAEAFVVEAESELKVIRELVCSAGRARKRG
jgi:hypothetical protein